MEACWAHNPEVGRSKLPPANFLSRISVREEIKTLPHKSTKENPAKFTLHCLRTTIQDLEFSENCKASRMARWKRAGPITQKSVDRNYLLLIFFQENRREKKLKQLPHKSTRENPVTFTPHCLRRTTKPGRQFS